MDSLTRSPPLPNRQRDRLASSEVDRDCLGTDRSIPFEIRTESEPMTEDVRHYESEATLKGELLE